MTLGEEIKAARELRGWTQPQLAQHLGVGESALSKWERDVTKPKSAMARVRAFIAQHLTTSDDSPAMLHAATAAQFAGELLSRLNELDALRAEVERLRATPALGAEGSAPKGVTESERAAGRHHLVSEG